MRKKAHKTYMQSAAHCLRRHELFSDIEEFIEESCK